MFEPAIAVDDCPRRVAGAFWLGSCQTPAKAENESRGLAGGKDWVSRGTKPEHLD